jgi:transcriptional regulator with XRE-family HTH domain
LKKARARAGLTQMQLAVAANVALSQISRWECDEQEPRLDKLRDIVRVLGVPLDELVGV